MLQPIIIDIYYNKTTNYSIDNINKVLKGIEKGKLPISITQNL